MSHPHPLDNSHLESINLLLAVLQEQRLIRPSDIIHLQINQVPKANPSFLGEDGVEELKEEHLSANTCRGIFASM